MNMDVVVVGASLAGIRAVDELRRRGLTGRVTLIGAEQHLPYDRPPLSKAVLSDGRFPHEFPLRATGYGDLNVDMRLGCTAVGLDINARTVALDDGTEVPFERVLIATGSAPRRLPPHMGAGLTGIHLLRTADDAVAIRAGMRAARRLVVVGAGFIGCEVASSAHALGVEVTVIEALETPLARALSPELGAAVALLQRDHGVDLRCGLGVAAFDGDGAVERVRLADGSTVEADLVVVGVGVAPATGWLGGSGLEIDDGVYCDSTCAAVGAAGVYAAGDVARVEHPLLGRAIRLEHWTNAAQQGAAAAANLLAGPSAASPFADVAYFWSDQFGVKIQSVGWSGPDDEITIVSGSPAEHRFAAIATRGDRLVGCFGMNRAPLVMRARALIAAGGSRREALALAA